MRTILSTLEKMISMAAFIFRAEQFVPRPLDEVFEFFSRAENLQQLTPPWLNFRILSVEPATVREGTLIRYSLRWRVFPIRWTTRITDWEPPHRFVDLQLKGPYKLWRHEHRFVAEGEGTRISDEVHYILPFGILGRIAHSMKVKSDVEAIFAYRREVVSRVFASRG
jgi:ligand-binding SRPBCC domain-containing protein